MRMHLQRARSMLLAISCAMTAGCSPSPPGIDRIQPPGGVPGTILTVTGNGFDSETRATLGNQALEDISVEGEQRLTGRVPTLEPGEHALVVTTGDGRQTTIPRAFAIDVAHPDRPVQAR